MITHSKKLGFTLVEVLVAISILSISILATFTAVQGALRSTNFSEDQIIAYYLADEALEYIRSVRDSNGIQHISALGSSSTYNWLTNISPACTTACYVDVPNDRITACSSNPASCPMLLYNASNGLYQYTAGSPTMYRRWVSVTPISTTEVSVDVFVSWNAQGISKTHTQKLVLRNWTE